MRQFIKLIGAKLHNLKNIDVDIPQGEITVVCGPSGCGKSTLILDTLHGESKRRYLETLSPFAVDLLGGKKSIPIDSAENLSASMAISQNYGNVPLKSYALSLCEIDKTLQNLFSRLAYFRCPICNSIMDSTSRENIIKEIASLNIGEKISILAPIDTQSKTLEDISSQYLSQGFIRIYADKENISIDNLNDNLNDNLKKIVPKEVEIIIDRIIIRENSRTRIAEAIDTALNLTHHKVNILCGDTEICYSTIPVCKNYKQSNHRNQQLNNFKTINEKLFSPYSKEGACNKCKGFGFIEDETCSECKGLRIKKYLLDSCIKSNQNNKEVYISWRDLLNFSFEKIGNVLIEIFNDKLPDKLKPSLEELLKRIKAINQMGLAYLTLGRAGTTLSLGEIQRLKLSTLASGLLNGLLICLDEPASGLHENDVKKLWCIIDEIKKRGNTIVLIEHHPYIIEHCDYIIEMGPSAGEKGGEILFQGKREELLKNLNSPTAYWLNQLRKPKNKKEIQVKQESIDIINFKQFDMKPISAHFPIGKFSVITGESGSGKSTLLFYGLKKMSEQGLFQNKGIEGLSVLTTTDFKGNRRSTILSAIGLANPLKELFAKLPESKLRGYSDSRFSLNVKGGRCEYCKGEGVIIDEHFYEELQCPICDGKRFRDEILEVRFKSLSIYDILNLNVKKAYELFYNFKNFSDKLKPLMDTGLDYLKLGQTTSQLSGGERARLRLSITLSKAKFPHTLFLFDEPARGLHLKDIELLLTLIFRLNTLGHTVIAVEHNQNFIDNADYVIELKRET